MIFNSSEGRDESREGDKLLYHWTKDATNFKVSRDEQIDDICLCDASLNVSYRLGRDMSRSTQLNHQNSGHKVEDNGRLRPNKSLVLTFENTLILVVEVESKESIWMAAHVAPPSTNDCEGGSQNVQRMDTSCIPAEAIKRILNNIYARFCLLNGTYEMISAKVLEDETCDNIDSERRRKIVRERIRLICENYFDQILPDIHLNSFISNVASLYNYILYLDLDPITLMKVNSFINHLVCLNATQIRHTIVIFNDQLLWSSLNMHDTRLLYNYLVSILIRDALQEELSKEVDRVRRLTENTAIYLGDTSDIDGGISADSTLDDSLEGERQAALTRKLTKFYLTVFRSSNNMTVGLLLSDPNLTDLIQKCEQILTSDSRVSVVPLASLAQSVGQSFLKANTKIYQKPQPTYQQQSTAMGLSASPGNWKKTTPVSGGRKLTNQLDQKYIFMDKTDVSISWPPCMDMQNKEHLLVSSLDSGIHDLPNGKKMRLIKYLIELEPEVGELHRRLGSPLVEFLGRTHNDSWITFTNTAYKSIYSVHNVRNSGLSEAQQSAINLRSLFTGRRF